MEEPATIALHPAKVFTFDPERLWARALAIGGNRMVTVGPNDEIRPLGSESTLSIDLDGWASFRASAPLHAHVPTVSGA
jgi:predicted amidohydrolase YtcJ